jgi:hypothetical protein
MRRTTAWVLALAAVLVTAVALFAYFSGIGALLLGAIPMRFDRVECAKIASPVASGRLKPDAAGVVVLPPGLPRATIDGRVYVTRKGSGRLFVLFPMQWGFHDADMEGYLYSSRPLSKADVQADPAGRWPDIITVTGPTPGLGKYAGPVPYTITKKVDPNWYAVSYEMD